MQLVWEQLVVSGIAVKVRNVDGVEFVPDVDAGWSLWCRVGVAAVAGGAFDEGATLAAY